MIYQYKHREWFKDVETPIFNKDKKIFLWGAGKIATLVAHALLKKGYEFEAFIDIAKDKQGTIFYGHKVISPEEFWEHYKNEMVIVSCTFTEVLDMLIKGGATDCWDPHSLLMEVDMDGYEGNFNFEYIERMTNNALNCFALYFKQGYLINKLYFEITDKCTLKCINCDGCIPYFKNPKTDSYDDIISSYNTIVEVCGKVDQVNLFGGEPLLHPEIEKLVEYFVRDERCEEVIIISNGTLPLKEELVKELKNSKAGLRISDYGELSRRKAEIIEVCKKEGIRLEITNYQYWDKIPKIRYMNETKAELDKKYAMCTTNYLYIKHRKAFHCVFTSAISSINEKMIPDFEKNYVELNENNIAELHDFVMQLINKEHIDACKYCPGSHCVHWEEKVPAAEQADGIIPENELYENGVGI